MKLSAKGAAFIRRHEGFVGKYYLDPVGIPTIGIGFTWRSAAFRGWWANNKKIPFDSRATISKAEADEALIYLVEKEYGKAVNKFLGTQKVPQHVFDAMCSMTFNCGPGSLKWQWAQHVKNGDMKTAAAKLRTTAITAKGRRLSGLVRRRAEEANLLLGGVYDVNEQALKDAMADGVLRRGEEGPAVKKLIEDLHKLGYYDGSLDDIFGPATESAVLSFQKAKGLEPDGIVGPKTFAAMKADMPVEKEIKETSPDKLSTLGRIWEWMFG